MLLLSSAVSAGDYIKFNWPQAWSISMLSWVALMYPEGLQATGSYDTLLSNIRCARSQHRSAASCPAGQLPLASPRSHAVAVMALLGA